ATTSLRKGHALERNMRQSAASSPNHGDNSAKRVSRFVREDLGEVLVAAAGEADEDQLRVEVERARQCMGRLERRDDALGLAQAVERRERVVVRRSDVEIGRA